MASSPGRSPPTHGGEYGAANVQLQVRFESSSEDDDDEDEHKLHIDLGSAAEEDPTPQPSAGPFEGGGAAATGLVASGGSPPAAPEAQISSAADASGSAKGCDLICAGTSATISLSSSQLQQRSSPPPTAPPSVNAQFPSAISWTPAPAPSSSPVHAASTSTIAPTTAAIYDPVSTASADNNAVAEDEDDDVEEEEEEEEEEEGANRVSEATIQRVLKKLNAAAIDEINLRTLQELPSEEASSFNRFRKMLSNHAPFETMPGLSAMVGGGGAAAFAARQQLTALMRQQERHSSPGDPYAFPLMRTPPALTAIPSMDASTMTSRQPGRRRSPPPMVPIASFQGRASGGAVNVFDAFGDAAKEHEAHSVIDRLKRLGTDVAVEPLSPPQFALEDEELEEYDDDDDDDLPFVQPECILSFEPPPVVTKVAQLPSLMPIPGDQGRGVSLSRVPLPPPSLIPIQRTPSKWPTARFVPILPREPPPSYNITVTQTAATPGPSTTFSRLPSNVVFSTSQKFSFSSANAAFKKTKKPKPSNKSHFTKLANSLVLPAYAPRKRDAVQLAESVLAEAMKPKSSARLGELEIIKVGPATGHNEPKPIMRPVTPPHLTFTATSTNVVEPPDVDRLIAPFAQMALPAPLMPNSGSIGAAPVTCGAKPNFFEFSLKKFANSTVTTKNERKLYGCCVCSTAYHKMFSLKKHFYRTHVNPWHITREDALKYDVAVPPTNVTAGSRPLSEMYKCDSCAALFGDHELLRQHMAEHRPPNFEHANRYRCSSCNFVFRKEKVFTRHLLECSGTVVAAPTPPPAPVAAVIEAQPSEAIVVAAAPVLDAGVQVAQSEVPNDDKRDESAAVAPQPIVMAAAPPKSDVVEKTDEMVTATNTTNMMCLFCEVTFKDNTERQKHVLQNHHPKRKQQACAYCKKKDINDLRDLLQHICEVHDKKYFGCARCKIRFKTKDELTAHQQESHACNGPAGTERTATAMEKPKPAASVKTKNGRTFRCSKCLKLCRGMTELLSHRKTAHYQPKSKIKQHAFDGSGDFLVTRAKHTPYSTDDYETEFYRNISQNVRTNLECYLDGKLDQKAPAESKCVTRSSQNNNILGGGGNDGDAADAPSHGLGFVEMYGRENFNAAFLRNASRLHIGTQLTMLKKTNVLPQDGGAEAQPLAGGASVASKLSLTPQKLNAISVSEEGTKSVTELSSKEIEFSGEWIRPRRYVCKVCLLRFNGFWEIEDHFWAKHPNVWHSFYEFPAEQDPGMEFLQTCKRFLSHTGVFAKADTKWSTATPSSECTKCGLVVTPLAEFHKHILECGGDTNWMATMYTPTKKHKKWRPYSGHRRRRTVTKNRMCVRNIPETPMKIPSQSKGKQKAGDSETIQKMIANLPPKRITRRVVNFDDINRPRFLTRTSVLTRRRREQVDPKASARIAKTISADNVDVMNLVRRRRPGSKPTFKVPSSVRNHQQLPGQLSITADPALQPVVQAEAVEVDDKAGIISPNFAAHESGASLADYETPIVDGQLDGEKSPLDSQVEANDRIGSEDTFVLIDEEILKSSTPKSESIEEILPAEIAPSVATIEDALPDEVPAVCVPVEAAPADIAPEIPVAAVSPVRIEDTTPAETAEETPVEVTSVDTLPEESQVVDAAVGEAVVPIVAEEKPPAVETPTESLDEEPSLITMPSPAGRQSPTLPDSSVILAAMAQTFGETDAMATSNAFGGSRKRKRGSKQPKCKKCGTKSTKKQPQCTCSVQQLQKLQTNEAEETSGARQLLSLRRRTPPTKRRAVAVRHANFSQFVCESCGSEVFSTPREGQICDMCIEKEAVAAKETCNELPSASPPPPPSNRVCGECGCAVASSALDASALDASVCDKCAARKECVACGDKFEAQDAAVCPKCAAASPQGTAVPVTTAEVTETTACGGCGDTCADLSAGLCVHCQPKQSYDTGFTPRFHEVPSTSTAAFEMPRTPSPVRVEDSHCIHCNEITSDRNDTGDPACRMCHELWITLNTDNLEPVSSADGMDIDCIECHILRTTEATSHQSCDSCTAKKCSLAAAAVPATSDADSRRRSSEVSVQAGEPGGAADPYSQSAKMPTLTPAIPGAASANAAKPSDDLNKLSTTKNTLLLICKGCYGTYNTVSGYKEHRQQCPFRNSDDEASKKPLLGFAKRIKSGVEIVQVDSPGIGSFEIDGGVLQMPDDIMGVGNVLPKVEPSDSISGQSTSSVEMEMSAGSRRIKHRMATDESMEEAINSVIQRFCSTSTPIGKKEDRRSVEAAAESSLDMSAIASESSGVAAKKGTKRLRSKPVDSPTRARNMRAVETQVEKFLQSSKGKKTAARKVFSFTDAMETSDTEQSNGDASGVVKEEEEPKASPLPEAFADESLESDSESFKKKLRSTKTQLAGKTRAQKKLNAFINSLVETSATEVPAPEEEPATSVQNPEPKESPRGGKKKALKKRRAEDEVINQSSEVRLSSRLRRKSLPTDEGVASRVLRSKSRSDAVEESKDEVPLPLIAQDEDVVESIKAEPEVPPQPEPSAKESTSTEHRRNAPTDENKTKPVESEPASAEPEVSASTNTDADVKALKTKGSKRKADAKEATGATNVKRTRSSSKDLGFNVAKTGKSVRSSARVKDEADTAISEDANSPAAEVPAAATEDPSSSPADSAAAALPPQPSERGNFLELGPSVPQSYLQVSSIGERPASAEGPKVHPTVAEEESMANHCRDQSNDLEQQDQHQLRFMESLSDSNFKDTAEMQRIQQNLERSFSYVISILNAVCEVLGSPEVCSANSLDPSVAEELEELKKYADVASEAVLMLKNVKTEDNSVDFNHDFSYRIFKTNEPPKLYSELDSQMKHSKDFVIHRSSNENKAQNSVIQNSAPVVNGAKTAAVVKNGKVKSAKNQLNGAKQLRCNHCQKVLPTKNEMAAHIQDHFRRFTTSKKNNAAMLKMCIADGFEQLLKDKAIDSFLKFSDVAEKGLCAPLKMLTQSQENQLDKWKSIVTQLVEIENEASTKPVPVTLRAKNGKSYQCPMCSTTYEQKQLRDRHLMMVHSRHSSSQKFVLDLDSAKAARASVTIDSVISANTNACKKDATVKCNGSLVPTVDAATDATSKTICPPPTAAAAGGSTTKCERLAGASAPPVSLPKPDPASLPPPLLTAHVEMPAPSADDAAALHQSPPALTIASPIANARSPKTPPTLPVAATPVLVAAAQPPVAVTPPPVAAAQPPVVVTKSPVAATKPPAAAKKPKKRSTPAKGAATAKSKGAVKGAAVRAKRGAEKGATPAKAGRMKMSRKGMELPPHVIKAKAEEALRELTFSRFNHRF